MWLEAIIIHFTVLIFGEAGHLYIDELMKSEAIVLVRLHSAYLEYKIVRQKPLPAPPSVLPLSCALCPHDCKINIYVEVGMQTHHSVLTVHASHIKHKFPKSTLCTHTCTYNTARQAAL